MTAVEDVRPIRRAEGLVLSRVQYARLLDVLDALTPDEWSLPTDCEGWDVRAVASHVLGGLECVRAPREFLRVLRAGRAVARKRGYADFNDGINDVQVAEHAHLSGPEVAAGIRAIAERALAQRARTPWLLRQGVRPRLAVAGRAPLGWVLDVVYTRDTFLHRVDVCRATGRDLVVDDAEQRVVADVVAEWAARHARPVTLRLSGPAGGTYECAGGGEPLTLDAVELTRLVSGRGTGEGLLAVPVQV